MSSALPPTADTNRGGMQAVSVAPPKGGDSLDRKVLADRRLEIEKNEKLKLHLEDWEEAKKEDLLKLESYRGRCIAVMTELYQLMGFYSLFQGVVFSAVSNRKLSCPTAVFPFLLSLLTSIATAVSIHCKLGFYETEKLKFIRAELDVNSLIQKINKLKGQGKDFKFEEIDDSNSYSNKEAILTRKLADAKKVHRWFYRAAMSFLSVFSSIILISCFVVLCAK